MAEALSENDPKPSQRNRIHVNRAEFSQRALAPSEKHKHAGAPESRISTSNKEDIDISEREFLHTNVWCPVHGAKRRVAVKG